MDSKDKIEYAPKGMFPEDDAEDTYDIKLTEWDNLPASSAIIEAVSHDEITNLTIESIKDKLLEGGLYVDIKSRADKLELISHGYNVWRL